MRIEVCGDRVAHVIASATSEIPGAWVKVGKSNIRLSTAMITVTVASASGAVSFLSRGATGFCFALAVAPNPPFLRPRSCGDDQDNSDLSGH
jgi:hypothetical protein